MNRTYAAKRLLEHGPLTTQQVTEITGWAKKQAARTLQQLLTTGVAVCGYEWDQDKRPHHPAKTRVYSLNQEGA